MVLIWHLKLYSSSTYRTYFLEQQSTMTKVKTLSHFTLIRFQLSRSLIQPVSEVWVQLYEYIPAHASTNENGNTLVHSRGTYYMHFSQHNPSHHNDTTSDGVHTPFSSLDTPPVFLTVISLPICCIESASSFRIIVYCCTLLTGLRSVMPLIK